MYRNKYRQWCCPGNKNRVFRLNHRLVGARGVYLEGCGDCEVTGNVFEVEGKKPEHRLWYRNSERIASDVK